MIDFENANYVKLRKTKDDEFASKLDPILIQGEDYVASFRGVRDGVVFTNKRIITINVQGVTGKKKDFTSIPYSKIQLYSIETGGTFDMDSELIVWLSGSLQIRFEFFANSNIAQICQIISSYVM